MTQKTTTITLNTITAAPPNEQPITTAAPTGREGKNNLYAFLLTLH